MVKKQMDATKTLQDVRKVLDSGAFFLSTAQALTSMVDEMIKANQLAKQKAWADMGEEKEEDSPYEILGVFNTSSDAEIKAVYKARVKFHHPDVGGDPRIFEIIQSAYEKIKKERGFK